MESRKNVWLVTGPPAIGKSTLVSKVIFTLRSKGTIVGGCVTTEKRVNRQRVGFRLTDLLTEEEGELASVSSRLGPRVGKYRVNLNDLSSIGAKALLEASKSAEIIVIDEVGPMELTSPDFRRALQVCDSSRKPILAVIHERMNDPLIEELKGLSHGKIFNLDLENRDPLAREISRQILLELAGGEGQ